MKKSILSLAIAVALMGTAPSQAATSDVDPEVRAQIEALKAEIQKIDDLKAQMEALEKRLAESEAKAEAAAVERWWSQPRWQDTKRVYSGTFVGRMNE